MRALGEFLDHDLNYARIQKNPIGRVVSPNTVWKEESGAETFSPINRWKTKLTQTEIAALEALIGDCLEEFAYPLTTETGRNPSENLDPSLSFMRVLYPSYFATKLFLQSKTIVGRLAKGKRLELSDPV